MTRAPVKPKKLRALSASAEAAFMRTDALLSESKKFCRAVGLQTNLISKIAKQDSDWAFVVKIDALLEMASKELIRDSSWFDMMKHHLKNERLADLVNALPVSGRLSTVTLLKATDCPAEDVGFIEALRKVRDAYAHEIRFVDTALIEVIKQRRDKSELLKSLSSTASYNEASLIAAYEKDRNFLRFCILDALMRILIFTYQAALTGKRSESAAQRASASPSFPADV